jgi:transcriptional regulator with XRE-family HTH domain
LCKVVLRAQKPPHGLFRKEIRTFGDHLRARRMELGLSQPECARRLRVALSSISNWERDSYPPDPKNLPALHDFLGCCLVGDARPLRDRLREWRLARGLSQRQVARRFDVTTKTVRRLEGTNTRPTAELREAVERLLTQGGHDADQVRAESPRKPLPAASA